ncbi:MAG: NAD-dependent epimerase/dehydratase family protein [Bacteriovoracaceae bacterium]|nr:NAD-dependent epimerase/dehydratase family protein [Bacteriovoracaceae bacterium]
MKILITGGAGFIGSHLVHQLNLEHEIYIIDDLSSGNSDYLAGAKYHFFQMKIENHELVHGLFEKYHFEVVIHLAAKASVAFCENNPVKAKEINFEASVNLLKISQLFKVKKFIFASSASVYGIPQSLPLSESQLELNPISLYGQWKLDFENELLKAESIISYSFRFFNVYGERQDPKSPYSGVISLFLNEFKKDDDTLPSIKIFGTGEQTRDFIYVGEIVKVMNYFLNSKIASGKFNLGTGIQSSLLDLVFILENVANKKSSLNFLPRQPNDILHSVADIGLLKKVMPSFSSIGLLEGIKKLFHHH